VSDRFSLKNLFERAELPGISDLAAEKDVIRQGRIRLLALLFLFDSLLIVATLLSFQKTELRIREIQVLETQEAVERFVEQVNVTETIRTTEIIPYGAPTPTPPPGWR
jgi:hypothetical protein